MPLEIAFYPFSLDNRSGFCTHTLLVILGNGWCVVNLGVKILKRTFGYNVSSHIKWIIELSRAAKI